MPFTLVAFVETQAPGTLINIAGLADPHLRVQGDYIYIPTELPYIAGIYFLGPKLTQCRLASPTLRTLTNLDVEPFDVGAEPLQATAFHDKFASPKPVKGDEGLEALHSMSGGEKAYATCLVWLSNGPITPVTGEIFTIRATNTTTLTARTWTNGALTFDQTLPAGRYQIVGMRAVSAGLIAARLVIPGSPWRPGCIGYDAVGDIEADAFRMGKMGVWGEFSHDVPPTVDFLSLSADSSQVVYLDLIKIA